MAGNDSKTKQVILMREDLNLSSGKMIAQGSHASLSAILNKNTSGKNDKISIDLVQEELEWFNERFTKVVLGVKSEEELMDFYNKAVQAGLNVSRPIIDAGFTELDKPTLTCVAIGPNFNEKIDEITGSLRVFSGTKKEKKIRKFLKKLFLSTSDKNVLEQLKDFVD